MLLESWLQTLFQSRLRPPRGARRRSRRDRIDAPRLFSSWVEPLEERVLLSADDVISVARTLSAWTTADLQGNELTITYTVFNQQAGEQVDSVTLTTTLGAGVSFVSASLPTTVNGQELSWNLGTIAEAGWRSVDVTVSLDASIPLVIDGGATAAGTANSVAVNDGANPIVLRTDAIAPDLLAPTADANSIDPYVLAKAAQYDQDPTQIFEYMAHSIGYESYPGSLRGARGTLWSEAGNSLDQASLLVALLRSSGVPAQYAHGTLSDPDAQELILSMFSEPLRVTGFIADGLEVSDPANDPQLLAEARDHFWAQFDVGAGFADADPTLADNVLGQTLTTADDTFAEVADALRHKVTIRLNRELTIPAAGLLTGGLSQDVSTVLEFTLNAVDLVGRSISVGNFVSTQTVGSPTFGATTNTYTPYLIIGEVASDVSEDDFETGQSYQEVFTNFPLGNQIVTGLFLEIDLIDPDGSVATFERTLADRIGLEARRHGGTTVVNLGVEPLPIVGPVDVTTINVSAAGYDVRALQGADANLELLRSQIETIMAQIEATPAGPERDALVNTADQLLSNALIVSGRAKLAQFTENSDTLTQGLADTALVKAYFDRPRILIASNTLRFTDEGTPVLGFALDLLKDDLRAIPRPGQASQAAAAFLSSRGFHESYLESTILGEPVGIDGIEVQTPVTTVQIFQAASAQEIEIVTLSADDLAQLENLQISTEAKIRIGDSLAAGDLVIVPARAVLIDGEERIGWFVRKTATGEIIGVLEDGTHGSGVTEFLFTEFDAIERATGPVEQFAAGFLVGANATSVGNVYKLLLGIYISQLDPTGAANIKSAISAAINSFRVAAESTLIGKGTAFAAGFALGFTLSAIYSTDPPVGNGMLRPPPTPEFETLTGTDVAVGIIPDPLFHVPFGGVQLQTVFRVGIKNLGSDTARFGLDVFDVPAGFIALTSVPEIEIPAGTVGEVGLILIPTGPLPAAGTDASFAFSVTDVNAPSVTETVNESFVVPAISAATFELSPAEVSSIPGAPVETTLTITSVGNTPASITFDVNLPADVALSGLNPVVLNPGEVSVQTLTLTPNGSVPLNSLRSVSITPQFGQPEPEAFLINLVVAAPGAAAIARAATAADSLGNAPLALRLRDLNLALGNLVQDTANPVFRSQALASLDSILTMLAVDPVLAGFVGPLSLGRSALAAAGTPAEIQSAVQDLGNALDDFGEVVEALSRGNFNVSLLPGSAAAQPQVPRQFDIILQNVGTETTTYNLGLSGIPADVDGQLSMTSVTLAPGEIASGLSATLTQTSTTELTAFEFTVDVSIDGAPQIVKSAVGSMRTRREFIAVTSVNLDAPFADPGDPVSVSARLLNSVNRAQQAMVSFRVLDPDMQEVFASLPVAVSLTLQTSLADVDLGQIDTTGLALGQYTVEVVVEDGNGDPIPGAAGAATLLIGSPVTASLTVSPDQLPPGTSSVLNTLQIDATIDVGDPLTIVGQLSLDQLLNDTIYGVTVNGSIIYVFGNQGLHVVDAADPTAPSLLTTKTGFRHTQGEIVGNVLIAVDSGLPTGIAVFANSSVTSYDLGGIFGTAQNPGRVQTIFPNYQFLSDIVISPGGSNLFASYNKVRFDTGTGDVFSQTGTVISFNISNPFSLSIPAAAGILLNTNGPEAQAPLFESGGNFNMFSIVQPNSTTLLVGSTTSTGTNAQTGVGRILVVDVSDPNNINSDPPNTSKIVNELQIPGTTQVQGIAIEGDLAFVLASEGGWRDPFTDANDIGPTGNIVMSTVDISDPRNPVLLHTQTLARSARGMSDPISLGNGRFAFGSLGLLDPVPDAPQLFIVDASDPTDIQIIEQLDLPGEIRGLDTDGTYLYATGDDGLTIYQLGGAGNIPVTAQVQVPNNTGVQVDSGSFSVAPTQIISGADFDTLVWELLLDGGNPSQTITWNSTITGLQPGETRAVTLESTVDFVSQSTPGQIGLPKQNVYAEQLLSIAPESETAAPGADSQFVVTIANPSQLEVTYDLSVAGIPQDWVVALPSTVTVGAGESVDVGLTLRSDPFAGEGEFAFLVNASVTGVTGSIEAVLNLVGAPVLNDAIPDAHGVVVELDPPTSAGGPGTAANSIVRITNTGSLTEVFDLTLDLPAGFVGQLQQTSIEVPPGAGNFRDVQLSIVPPTDAPPGDYQFTVHAVSTHPEGASAEANGIVTVLPLGVTVSLSPGSASPGGFFEFTVTNTGQLAETFDISLGGPAAIVAAPAVTSVNLNPGESQTVQIDVDAVDFAFPGSLLLIATATAQSNPAIQQSDAASVDIGGFLALSAAFQQPGVQMSAPGSASFLLLIDNLGNFEDQYVATITGTTGPITAQLKRANGQLTQSIPLLILPGRTQGVLLLTTELLDFGEGTVTVEVRSLSDDSIVAESIATVVASSVAQSLVVDPVDPIFEGNLATLSGVATFDGSNGPATLAIHWGDPLSPQNTQNFSLGASALTEDADGINYNPATGAFSLSHRYLDDNPSNSSEDTYSITVELTASAGTLTAGETVLVKNSAPQIVGLESSTADCGCTAANSPVSISGSFTDSGALDVHTVMVDWGDGTSSAATVVESGGSGTFAANHLYAQPGVYSVTVTVRDDDGGEAVETTQAIMSGVGVVDGVLYVIGTNSGDNILITLTGKKNQQYLIVADFLPGPGHKQLVDAQGIREIVVLACGGNDHVVVANCVKVPTFLDGGAGNDFLSGGAGPNVLWGGDGCDILVGGNSRDILIGGDGRDLLLGLKGDDILLAGTTVYDPAPGALGTGFLNAWRALLNEWTRNDKSFQQRVENIKTGGGLANGFRLNDETVRNDRDSDRLAGSSGNDWFLLDQRRDCAADLKRKDDVFTDIGAYLLI